MARGKGGVVGGDGWGEGEVVGGEGGGRGGSVGGWVGNTIKTFTNYVLENNVHLLMRGTFSI